MAAYHMRATSLIWSLDKISNSQHIESVIAKSLSAQDVTTVQEACEAFGVLWRLTGIQNCKFVSPYSHAVVDDSFVPGSRLKVPMMIVLDTLKNEDPSLRRMGETWMRCSLKSYLR